MPGSATAFRLAAALADTKHEKMREMAVKEILAAFRKTKGVATKAAKELEVSHRALTRWLRAYPDLAKRVKKAHPKRNTVRMLTFKGKTQSMADWAEELGISRQTIHHRLGYGWSTERALGEGVNSK